MSVATVDDLTVGENTDYYKKICPLLYDGAVCELINDACTPNPCLNQGTCTKRQCGEDFTCQCAPGYKGIRCETRDDPCMSAPCGTTATCTSSLTEYICQCPQGKVLVGTTCRTTSTNFVILGNSLSSNEAPKLQWPFRLEGTAMSIMLRFRIHQYSHSSVIATIQFQNSLTPEELMSANQEGMWLKLSPGGIMTYYNGFIVTHLWNDPDDDVSFNVFDHQWHHLGISITAGQMKLTIDAIRVSRGPITATEAELNFAYNGQVILGSNILAEYEDVVVWNTLVPQVDFKTAYENDAFYPIPDSIVQHWWNYYIPQSSERQTARRSTLLSSSLCLAGTAYNKDTSTCYDCPRGTYKTSRGNEDCKECQTGTTTLGVASKSPNDCSQVVCPKGTYGKIVNSAIVCTLCPVGKYSNTVMQDDCISCATTQTTLTTGATTSLDCIPDCDEGFGYDTTVQACRICRVNFFNNKADPYPNTCKLCPYNRTNTLSGSTSCSLVIPDPVSPPVQLVTIIVPAIHQLNVDNCDTFSTTTSEIVRLQVKTKLIQIFEDKAAGFSNNWCNGIGCSNIDVIYTSCSAAAAATRRKRALVNSNFEFIFRNISKLVTDSANGAVIQTKEILAQTLIINARSLDIEGGINFIGFGTFSELCLPGQYRSSIECMPCPQGTYSLGGDYAQCTPCQSNYYQDLTGTAGCKPCPALKYTDTTGSVSSDVCKARDEIKLASVIIPVVVTVLVVVGVIVVVVAYRRGLFGKLFTRNRQQYSTNSPSQDTPSIELAYVNHHLGSMNVSSEYSKLDSEQRPAIQNQTVNEM